MLRDTLPQCDCEYTDCTHVPGHCQRVAPYKVCAYGHTENLCVVCLGILEAFAGQGDVRLLTGSPADPVPL